jgi:uncharacterized damage-inducible protein DinB
MTLHEATMLRAFSSWATNRILDAVTQLSDEQFRRDMKASHGSIYRTLAHMVGAEKIWLERWTGKPNPVFMKPEEVPSLRDIKARWEQVGYDTAKFFGSMTDKKLQDTFTMATASGEQHTHTFAQALLHVVDHSTYHRGQIITMLRQMGITPPTTGMIVFFRETAKLR